MDPNDQTNLQAQPAATVDPETIKNAVTEVFTSMAQQQQAAPREMTPEEQAEYYAIFNPRSNNFHETFGQAMASDDPEIRAKALEDYRDGVINQALRGAELIVEQRLQKLMPQLQPAIKQSAKAVQEETWAEFAQANPHLAQHREVVDMVATQLATTGFKPRDKKELFTRVSEVTGQMLNKLGAKVTPATNQPRTQNPGMTTSHIGGSGGVQHSSAAPAGARIAPFFLNRNR